jgi:hypothetical protein
MFPSILSKAKEETENYIKSPFSRTGKISELHFGQAMFAFEKKTQTILKTEKADMLLVPTSYTSITFDVHSAAANSKSKGKPNPSKQIANGAVKKGPLKGIKESASTSAPVTVSASNVKATANKSLLGDVSAAAESVDAKQANGSDDDQNGDLLAILARYQVTFYAFVFIIFIIL